MRFVVKPMIYLIKRARGKLENNDTSKSREDGGIEEPLIDGSWV